jgi:hypothetical protein
VDLKGIRSVGYHLIYRDRVLGNTASLNTGLLDPLPFRTRPYRQHDSDNIAYALMDAPLPLFLGGFGCRKADAEWKTTRSAKLDKLDERWLY